MPTVNVRDNYLINQVQLAPEQPTLCTQCKGDLLGADSEGTLICGTCGWPHKIPVPSDPRPAPSHIRADPINSTLTVDSETDDGTPYAPEPAEPAVDVPDPQPVSRTSHLQSSRDTDEDMPPARWSGPQQVPDIQSAEANHETTAAAPAAPVVDQGLASAARDRDTGPVAAPEPTEQSSPLPERPAPSAQRGAAASQPPGRHVRKRQ